MQQERVPKSFLKNYCVVLVFTNREVAVKAAQYRPLRRQ
jgi:hypothetical protein